MMKILISINDDYLGQLIVLLRSLADNNKGDVEIIILDANLSQRSKRIIKTYIRRFGYKLRYVLVDGDLFMNAPNRANISIETYFRLLAFDVLHDVKKVLYLDADMVVDGSLRSLWEINLDDYCIAGVKDQGTIQEDLYHRAELGLKKDSIYINGGVLLMNLENIRAKTSVAAILAYINDMGGKLKYQDQDIINVLFEDDILYLPEKYNYTPMYRDNKDFIDYYGYPKKRMKPVIIHYMGEMKPWIDFYGYKFFKEYKKYCIKTRCGSLKTKVILNSIRRPFSLLLQYRKERIYNS